MYQSDGEERPLDLVKRSTKEVTLQKAKMCYPFAQAVPEISACASIWTSREVRDHPVGTFYPNPPSQCTGFKPSLNYFTILHWFPHTLLVMGWLWGSSKQEEPTVSTRQDRKQCWETRDTYFECLDRVGVVKAGEEGKACSVELGRYEENCAKSWVCTLPCCPLLMTDPAERLNISIRDVW